MKFAAREDIEAPIGEVFAALTDFERFEREALRRGAEVEAGGDLSSPGPGRFWTVRFRHRGRNRELATRIETYERPRALATQGRIGGYEGRLALELTELAPRRTRLRAELEVKPRTLTARLMLQSLKLARSSLAGRFKARFHAFARALEQNRGARRG